MITFSETIVVLLLTPRHPNATLIVWHHHALRVVKILIRLKVGALHTLWRWGNCLILPVPYTTMLSVSGQAPANRYAWLASRPRYHLQMSSIFF